MKLLIAGVGALMLGTVKLATLWIKREIYRMGEMIWRGDLRTVTGVILIVAGAALCVAGCLWERRAAKTAQSAGAPSRSSAGPAWMLFGVCAVLVGEIVMVTREIVSVVHVVEDSPYEIRDVWDFLLKVAGLVLFFIGCRKKPKPPDSEGGDAQT